MFVSCTIKQVKQDSNSKCDILPANPCTQTRAFQCHTVHSSAVTHNYNIEQLNTMASGIHYTVLPLHCVPKLSCFYTT